MQRVSEGLPRRSLAGLAQILGCSGWRVSRWGTPAAHRPDASAAAAGVSRRTCPRAADCASVQLLQAPTVLPAWLCRNPATMKFEISDESVLMLSGVGVATVAGFALLAPREHHNVFFAKASGEVPPGPKARTASLHAARQKNCMQPARFVWR